MLDSLKLKFNQNNALRNTVLYTALLLLVFTAASCAENTDNGANDAPGENGENPGEPNGNNKPPDYEALGVNELGQIMVLMYHRIGEEEAEWVRTPENLRKDLENLYAEGYRLVSMNDVLDGNIDIPAGTSPVVLTFDDSSPCQFRYIEQDGELVVDPGCAVGILEQFYEEHPDFGLAATFYMIAVAPFGQYAYVQQKMDYLVEKGFEIGNHTYSHGNLRNLPPEGARKEIAYHVKWTQEYLPGYEVRSLALPFGAHPEDKSYIIQGSYEGIDYHNEGILLVGANPARSPFDRRFDPVAIPRIRASEMKTDGVGMYEWMEILRDNPERRYISDGNPNTVVAPEHLKDYIDEARLSGKTLITY